MKFNINDYKGKYVMHCKTEEEAKDFIAYLKTTGWEHEWSLTCYYGKYVCFFNKGTWCSVDDAINQGYEILEWSDFMGEAKEFTKADLRTGDVVKFNNEELGIVIIEHNVIAYQNGSWGHLDNIKADLTNSYGVDNYNIVAVRRPKNPGECCFDAFRHHVPRGTLVYERKEVEEMTLAEVCKLLGKEIKIIK